MTERHPLNGRFVVANATADPTAHLGQRPDGPRADQAPANTGAGQHQAWPEASPRLTGPAPAVVEAGSVPVNPRPQHPENSGAGTVNVRLQRLDLPGSGPVVRRLGFHTAPTSANEGDGRD